ncbi:2-oxoglutarate dehydrogenase E1 component [Aliikangiella coralliicola]|uniref:2-oxoglutarate dehydrogenase E1 component n=1 Tax=Aliikangiella coralliicola TaxID=2592383 RepID=A0A545UGP1_9GAMM|nr:2-oxoglutarate dehydrogenase E1 component [Aliikangiella coralliicola]TQV88654.1 2-oxoglutarate dehydrogenase E1 component [Aliikangiella coralliicola]
MQEKYIDRMRSSSSLSGGSASYVEELYEQYLDSEESVSEEWRAYFKSIASELPAGQKDISHAQVKEQFSQLSNRRKISGTVSIEHETKQVAVLELIEAYRVRGHQVASLDPLGLMERKPVVDLALGYHGLSELDLNTKFQTKTLYFGEEQATLKNIIDALKKTYCTSVGAEFMHIVNSEEKKWFQERLESVQSHPKYDQQTKLKLLDRLIAAEGLEKYLGAKYPGTKRFGLEGGESLIPIVDELIQKAGSYNTKEVVIGMAHRGRLNVLINTLGKKASELIDEFEGTAEYEMGSGDVKYHQGFSSNVMTPGGEIHLALAFNPSHLEIVSPVVQGSARARQDKRRDLSGDTVVPINIHGDAAFSGQGVVMETLQMSQTRAYKTGGTVHIIINNQVGFTTSKKEDARSTEYCTDVAKVVEAPILHVNGDDPEAVLFVSQLAIDYRFRFKKDIVIDLVCYRRRGHNEADEPFGTQPLMYSIIRKLPSVLSQYSKSLVEHNQITNQQINQMADEYRANLEKGNSVVKGLVEDPDKALFFDWTPYLGHDWDTPADTTYDQQALVELAGEFCEVPEGFALQRQVQKVIEDRKLMASGELPVNWGFAETLAYGSILKGGNSVRITGQDVGRGTFSHRHAVLHHQKTGESYVPLQNLQNVEKRFTIYDSFLSELAVLGFEYGYATTNPMTMVIWEAQFGDFANGAQMIIDQFITSGEHKWGRLCGLTMLLPHGYEGQGPEHSSARLERFLQLCAEHNIQVCVPTTPAQIFHLLRRQVIRPMRRPLVIMSPKSLLRHKEAVSTMEELANGSFKNVLPETDDISPEKVTRLVMCSGRVYYDLLERRRQINAEHIAIVRIEQLYPFPEEELKAAISEYKNLDKAIWCQEEPKNQGAWYSSHHHLKDVVHAHNENLLVEFAGREASAAPAAGYMALHLKQLEEFITQAIGQK